MQGRGGIMGVRKSRLTLGRMMAVIAIVALGFALSRVDAAPAVSFCVFAACTWYLAGRRYAEALARRTAEVASIRRSQRARIAARCAVGAALVIGLPDAAFLGGFYGYMAVIRRAVASVQPGRPWDPQLDLSHVLIGALIGIAATLCVASIMRRGLKPAARKGRAAPAAADRTPSHSLLEHGRVAARRVSTC
jgi:hypothetical protein